MVRPASGPQVFLGKRVNVRAKSKDPEGAGAPLVALKFEHKTSKGCSNGPPYEWSVYGCGPHCVPAGQVALWFA